MRNMKLNGKRIFLYFMILLVIALLGVMFVACNVDDVKEISVTPDTINVRIGEFNYSDYTVTATYNSGKTEESVLKEDMISPSDRLKFFQEGEHEIVVNYLNKSTTIKVNVRRNVFEGVEFEDLDVVYNGEFYTLEVKNVPEGTTVTYASTNRFRTAGEYQVTAILRKDAYEMKEMTATITIRKADYDLSGISFEDKTEDYDGNAHVLEMTGEWPAGLYVDYTITREGGREEKGNSATNAGVYTVEARFSGDTVNYNEVESLHATLNIRQATIDMSGITFSDKTVVYDRTRQSIVVEGTLPRSVNVTYINNERVNAGVYEVKAVFSVDDTVNYAPIETKTATLTILKADYDMSTVHFNGTKVTYDGEEKRIEIQGQLPTGITVSYEGNVGIDAGSYEATAIFASNNVNYNDPEPMTATLIIDPAVAQMDQIVFERRRFISVVVEKGLEYSDDPDSYNPYRVANEYRPDNVPVGFAMNVEYKKTDNWQADLASETDEGPYINKITEDGYYVVKVTFDGGKNYVDEKPTVKTVIRVDTLDNDYISTWEQLVFDDLWVNPETGNTTGVFMDYYSGVCVDTGHLKTVTIGDITLEYCDCNVFLSYVDEGEDALIIDDRDDCYVPETKLNDYKAFGANYFAMITAGPSSVDSILSLLSGAEKASNTLEHDEYYFDDDPSYAFDSAKAAYVSLNGVSDYVLTNVAGKTVADYHEVLAHLFGFENVSDFFGPDKITGHVFGTYCNPTFLTTAGVSDNPLACKGAVYVKDENSDDYVFIFPYVLRFSEVKAEAIFLFCGVIGGETSYGALLNDAEALFDFFDNATTDSPVLLEGRCLTTELFMTEEGVVFRLSPKTKVVVENGVDVEKPITNGKDFIFVEKNGSTERLIYGDVEIYRFVSELPGNCAETSEGYDPAEYRITTNTTIYDFCDDDVFASVIKANGDATGIAKRTARDDHPQMTSAVADNFDELAELYQAFISNYLTGEDVVNEWKIAISNRNYAAYRTYFEFAADMMAKSNRNMGKGSEYVLSKSVIIGMNREFSISINSSGYNYTVDQYRLMVAKLFGFTDLDTFTAYTNALANELVANSKHASVDSVSARLLYDGAVMTTNGYFVLPYAIKSETSTNKVLAFIFVDGNGTMSIWINDARNAFNATNFGETVWDMSDKYTVTVYGRCMMFEDDGYIMNEDLGQNVVEMIDKLQQYPQYVFTAGGVKESCNDTDDTADYYMHLHDLGAKCSESYFGFVFGYNDGGMSVWYDDCNPFCMIYSDWVFDDVDALKEHSLYSVPENVVNTFNDLSDCFGSFIGRFDIPTDGTQYIPSIGGNAMNNYIAFYNAGMAIYNNSLLSFTRNVSGELSESAVIGLDHPYVMVFGTEIDPTSVDYQMVVANLFGFEDKDEFMHYVTELAALYAQYRTDVANSAAVNKAFENGCFLTANGSFVFPIAINNEHNAIVLAYLVLDVDGHVAMWINDISAALWATNFDENHYTEDGIMNTMYCKNMLFAREISYEAIFLFCDDDSIMNVQRANGDASEITKRVDRGDEGIIGDELAEKFDTLSELYAALFAHYTIQEGNNNWQVEEGGASYADYRRLFRYARDLFAASNNDLGKVNDYMLGGSAIIGMNKAFAISFADNDYSLEEYRLMLSKLFGFNDVDAFIKCADALASALAENGAGAAVDTIAHRLVYDGAVFTTNGYFILPYSIKNITSGKEVLVFVFVDGNGTMSLWINNVSDAFAATEFSAVLSHIDSPDFMYVSGRCLLFEENDYVGWDANGMEKYIAVEKAKAFASEGDFLIYSSFTDEEGFEVYWFSVYDFETQVVYEDSDTANIGTVHKGFYTMVNVANVDAVHVYNQYVIDTYEGNIY